jgi:4-amino-4-deoxy-L-arabinose transferase-like glycosyltransferase
MKRVFSSPIFPLLAGAFLRMLFVLKFPAGSGDTAIYEQLATNWLKHGKYAMDIAGQPVPVDLRMPGYPAFLALLYALTGGTGESARLAAMLAQVLVDLACCVAIAALAALLVFLCSRQANRQRAFLVGLWLAALCPFTANYVAVSLTEVWATFLTAVALLLLVMVAAEVRAEAPEWLRREWFRGKGYWRLVALAGLVVGVGALFRPETPLLLVTSMILLGLWMWWRGETRRFLLSAVLMVCACAAPLLPWTLRNAISLHEFQPLAPKDTMLPGEVSPRGFMAWERTWLFRVRDCYLVPWKLNDEAIRLEDVPPEAFDTPEERNRVAAVLQQYNQDLTLTTEEDAVFAHLARERTARHPLRTYLWIPLRRAVRIWFTPRIELLPVSGHVFPLAYMREEDPVDQRVTILIFLMNVLYVGLGIWGGWKLWKRRRSHAAVVLLVLYIVVRTAFLTTLETPEPRYVLECFPALIAMAAAVFVGPKQGVPVARK